MTLHLVRSSWSFPALMMGIFILIFISSGAAAAHADLFREHYELALRLYGEGKLDESLQEFKAAYAVHQLPRILINIAKIYRKLGHPREALTFLDMYRSLE